MQAAKSAFDAVVIVPGPFAVALSRGDIDERLRELLERQFPGTGLPRGMVRDVKEKFGFVVVGALELGMSMPIDKWNHLKSLRDGLSSRRVLTDYRIHPRISPRQIVPPD